MGTICYRERYGDEDGERDGRECTVTKSEYRTTMLINREVSEIKVKNRESYRVTEAIKTAQVHKMKKKGKGRDIWKWERCTQQHRGDTAVLGVQDLSSLLFCVVINAVVKRVKQ